MRHPLRAFVFASLALIAPAAASEYPLEQAGAIIPAAQIVHLHRAGVRTTEDFLRRGRTPFARRMLAQRASLAVEQVTAWVLLADLMRVRGVGPDVARLLTAVGVRSLADLQNADAATTASAIREYNRKTHLSQNPPGPESIRYWIEESRALPIVVSTD